jgi:hypothetical protein
MYHGKKIQSQQSAVCASRRRDGLSVPSSVSISPRVSRFSESGVFPRFEMKRQPRLRGVEQIGEIADALLAVPEADDDRNTRLVREGVKEPCGVADVDFGGVRHTSYSSIFIVLSSRSENKSR